MQHGYWTFPCPYWTFLDYLLFLIICATSPLHNHGWPRVHYTLLNFLPHLEEVFQQNGILAPFSNFVPVTLNGKFPSCSMWTASRFTATYITRFNAPCHHFWAYTKREVYGAVAHVDSTVMFCKFMEQLDM
jgi:hypothetical protein